MKYHYELWGEVQIVQRKMHQSDLVTTTVRGTEANPDSYGMVEQAASG